MESDVLKGLFYISLLCGIVTTVVVSAINVFVMRATPRWLLPCVAGFVTLFAVQINVTNVQDVQEFLLKIVLTMSFSVLFYTYLGKWFIDSLFEWLKTFIFAKLNSLSSQTSQPASSSSQEETSASVPQVPQEKQQDSAADEPLKTTDEENAK